jgi:hypothetical protein
MSVKIKEYDGPLFRAEEFGGSKPLGETAEQHYPSTINYHFFTTVEHEVEPYRKVGTKYTKTWMTNQPLVLLDIMDLNTRNWLLRAINAKNLNTAFPVVKNKVYRFSNNQTDMIDRAVLGKICNLTAPNGRRIDGYYMARQDIVPPNSNYTASFNRRLSKFHSEVGLCRHAFHKLTLEHIKTTKASQNGPRKGKKQTRRNYNSNNNTTRRAIGSPKKAKSSPISFNSPPRRSSLSFNTPPRPSAVLSFNSPPRRTAKSKLQF